MKMNYRRIGFAALAGCFVFLAAYYAAGLFAPVPGAATGAWPAVGAAAVILLNGFGLQLTDNRVLFIAPVSVPVIYIALVAANPWAQHWSAFHPASLLLLGAIFCYLAFCTIRPSMEVLAGCFFLLGASGLFVPPLFWLFPVLLLMGLNRIPSKGRYLVIATLSLAVPVFIYGAITYLRQDFAATREILPQLWTAMTDVHPGIRHFPAVTLTRILFTLAVTLAASLHIIRRLNRYKTVQALAFVRLIVLALAFSLMALVFPADAHTPCGLIICLPVTLLLNEYFVSSEKGWARTVLVIAALLLLIAERISLLL